MSLIKYNNRNRLFPWGNSRLRSFFDANDFFSDDFFAEDNLMPAMNIKEHEANFEVEFAAPGFTKEDFEITINEHILHVSGKKETTHEETEENYTRKEFSYSSFERSLQLPSTVNTEQEVKATYENGILKLHLQKNEEIPKKPKKIIKVE